MYISKFKIRNYKSFRESREVELRPGFNVIVGKNNSGKTALTEVLSLDFQNEPHKSQSTVPYQSSSSTGRSGVDVSFFMDMKEIRESLIEESGSVWVPRREGEGGERAGKRFMEWLGEGGKVELRSKYENGGKVSRESIPKTEGKKRAEINVNKNNRELVPSRRDGSGGVKMFQI
jgi:AAA15 family ATPase/GTPase